MDDNNDAIQDPEEFPHLKFTDDIEYIIFETAKWSKLLSIFGFIFVGFLVMIAVSISSLMAVLSKSNPYLAGLPGGASTLTVLYLLFAAIVLIPTIFLYQFSNNAKDGVTYNSELQLTTAFEKLKSFFKFWGIVTLVIVIFYVLMIVLTIIGGAGLVNTMK